MGQVDQMTITTEILTVTDLAGFCVAHAVSLLSLVPMDDQIGTFRTGHDLIGQFFCVTQVAFRGGFFPIMADQTTIHVGLIFASGLDAVAGIAVTIGTCIKPGRELSVTDTDSGTLDHLFDGRRVAIQTEPALNISRDRLRI